VEPNIATFVKKLEILVLTHQRQSLWTFSKSGGGKECFAPQRQSLWTFSKSGGGYRYNTLYCS